MAAGQNGSRNHHSTAYDLSLAWRNIRSRPVQSAITLIVVALALGLFVIVMALNDGLQRGIIKASDPFGVLVVGAKGSAQQLVLSTLLLQETPVGNIHRDIYEELRADPRVALAVPMAFGDNVGGARIIGTNQDFFQLRPAMNEPVSFVLSKGQTFAEPFEAVLGSKAAAELGLTVGDEFFPQHGVEVGLEDDVHAIPHRVVGILAPSNTAYDNAVFTPLESVWSVHAEHEYPEEEQHLEEASGDAADGLGLFDFTNPNPIDQVTAVLVRPSGFIEANELWRDLRIGSRAQAAFPGKELGGLFDLLNQGQQILTVVGYLAAIMAALTVLLAIYSATVAREHTIAVMRGLGAERSTVFLMVMFEAVVITLLGALLARLVGYAVAWVAANIITQQSAIPVAIRFMPELEPFLWLLPLALGLVAGLLPAIMAYRVNVVEKLFPA